jgi:tryptophanyl-tRNA synthetase
LQTADIVIYSSPADAGKEGAQLYVPVGEDQVSHVELSREIVRRFNGYYGRGLRADAFDEAKRPAMKVVLDVLATKMMPAKGHPYTPDQKAEIEIYIRNNIREVGLENFAYPNELRQLIDVEEVLTEPGHMLTKTPRIPGLDGRKMSKSYGNAITLSETDEEIRKKTKVMVTDPARKRRTDPGNPDVCPVFDWHKLFSAGEPGRLEWVRQGCTTAGIGCIECKAAMAENLIQWIGPKREARNKWEKDPKGVLEIIDDGSKRARVEAKKTMERVREAVFGWEKKRTELGNGSGPGAFDRSTD